MSYVGFKCNSRHTFLDIIDMIYCSKEIIKARVVGTPPFWPAPPPLRVQIPSLTTCRSTTGTIQSLIFGARFVQLLYCWKNQIEFTHDMQGPAHGDAAFSHATKFLHVAYPAKTHFHLLHIKGPSKCPQVDKLHPASITRTLTAIAGCSLNFRKMLCRRCSQCDGDNWKFS